MRYSIITKNSGRGGNSLDLVVKNHASMVDTLKAIQKKKDYDGNLKMIDVADLTDEASESED